MAGRLYPTVGVALLLFGASWAQACNESICASVVTKCMLTQSCNCDIDRCTCCKECFSCLSHLYDECCSCFDLCPQEIGEANPLSKRSHVEDVREPIPALFQALTADKDEHDRWISITYPVDFDPLTLFSIDVDREMTYQMLSDDWSHQLKPNVMTFNCTIAYIAHCTSFPKCRQTCQSMGASRFRWFHDGCCECVGDTCINYGSRESRCPHCPMEGAHELYDDYGQNLTDEELE